MRRWVLLWVAVTFLGSRQPVEAGLPLRNPVPDLEFDNASAVFTGVVVTASSELYASYGLQTFRVLRVEVADVYKGSLGLGDVIPVRVSDWNAAARFLSLADRSKSDFASVMHCVGSTVISGDNMVGKRIVVFMNNDIRLGAFSGICIFQDFTDIVVQGDRDLNYTSAIEFLNEWKKCNPIVGQSESVIGGWLADLSKELGSPLTELVYCGCLLLAALGAGVLAKVGVRLCRRWGRRDG